MLSFEANLAPIHIMADNNTNIISHNEIIQRTFTFVALGLPRANALTAADSTITEAWLNQMQADAEAAQALPTFGQRQTDTKQLTTDRNEALRQAKPLLIDTFFYAKKAYPGVAHADEYFSHALYTQAGSSADRQNKALQAAAAAFATRRTAMEAGGMPAAKIDLLLSLAENAQGKGTGHSAAQGESTVTTDVTDAVFAALWALCRVLHEAAEVAYRDNDAERRLFILYPSGPEERTLTIEPADKQTGAPSVRIVRLDSALSATRLLSCTVDAPGGPVQLLLQNSEAAPAPTAGTAQKTTASHLPARFHGADLGWLNDEYLYFVVLNPGPKTARVQVRVLPVGTV